MLVENKREKRQKDIYIIVPVFNEARVIAKTIGPLVKLGYTIVVVDDGSDDNTYEELKDFPICYLKHAINLGQGAALQTGMDFAKKHKASIVVHFDGDGQHNPGDIENLLRPIQNGTADITVGCRFGLSSDIPALKKIVLKCGTLVNGLLCGVWLKDAHNGLRAFNNDVLHAIELRINGMAHASEILLEIKKGGFRLEEIPVNIQYTTYSKSKGQSIWNAFHILIDLLLRKLLT